MRRWLTILAVFGVVLHAGLIARHNAMMVSAKLDHQALVTALAVICHGAGPTSETSNNSERPFVPVPAYPEQCHSCGALCGVAIAPVPDQVVAEIRTSEPAVRVSRQATRIAEETAGRRPPPTGPPSLV